MLDCVVTKMCREHSKYIAKSVLLVVSRVLLLQRGHTYSDPVAHVYGLPNRKPKILPRSRVGAQRQGAVWSNRNMEECTCQTMGLEVAGGQHLSLCPRSEFESQLCLLRAVPLTSCAIFCILVTLFML